MRATLTMYTTLPCDDGGDAVDLTVTKAKAYMILLSIMNKGFPCDVYGITLNTNRGDVGVHFETLSTTFPWNRRGSLRVEQAVCAQKMCLTPKTA